MNDITPNSGNGRRWATMAGLVVAGAVGGAVLAGAVSANAATTTPSTSSSSSSSDAQSGAQSGTQTLPAMPAHGSASHEDAEKAVTGADADKAKAAAIASVGSGTASEVTTDFTGKGYEVTVKKADGTTVEVHLDANFAVQQHGGPGGPGRHGPGDNDGDGPGSANAGTGSSTASPTA